MLNLAKSPAAPVLGQRVPVRGAARLLYLSYSKAPCRPGGPPKRLTTRFGDDFTIELSSFLEWHLWAFGSYEDHFGELFRHLLVPGDRCMDIGANIGIHTVRLAKLVGVAGEVIAVEPDEELALRADNNLLLNQLDNVRLVQAAASDRGGRTVPLYRPGTQQPNKGQASLLPHQHLKGHPATVPVTTVDNLNDGRPLALIKIDVEGHETAVVRGAVRTIDESLPCVIFEFDPQLAEDQAPSPFGWFRDKGYEMFSFRRQRHILTSRGVLKLERLHVLPTTAADILAVHSAKAQRIRPLVS
jgi:FkbM family methyltransferase